MNDCDNNIYDDMVDRALPFTAHLMTKHQPDEMKSYEHREYYDMLKRHKRAGCPGLDEPLHVLAGRVVRTPAVEKFIAEFEDLAHRIVQRLHTPSA